MSDTENATSAAEKPEIDMDAVLNTPHMPEDAGEFAPGLAAIMARIPRGWGMWIGVGRGWWPIVIGLDQQIAAIDSDYEIHQVKEKFGTLRYYCSGDASPEIDVLIRAAEAASAVTCEKCGAPGQLGVSHGWWSTACTEHAPKDFVTGSLE